MTVNDSKSYLDYLNKLVDQYNNTYHNSIIEKTYWCWLFCFDWKNCDEFILKLLYLKLMIESELLSVGICKVKFTMKIGQEKYLSSILFGKLFVGLIEVKI